MRKPHSPDALTQALAEPSRRAILENLRYGQKSVTELVQATHLKQPNVSNHLAKMRQQGLVRAERLGRQVYYSISSPFAEALFRLHEVVAHPLAPGTPDGAGATGNADRTDDILHLPQHGETLESTTPDTARIEAWREAYFQALLVGQEDRAVTLVNAMLAARLEMERIYIEVFQHALNRIGDLYVQGLTDEAHEHIASGITERMMAKVAQFYTPVVRVAYRALLGCVAGNWHALGLRMLADGLRELGWETLYLGANVPTDSFVALVETSRPELVVLSCVMEEQWEAARDLIAKLDAVRNNGHRVEFKIVAGGHFVHWRPDVVRELPIDFTARDLIQFLERVEEHFPIERLV